jgi:secreted trypsin-like serine protease
MKFCAQAKLPYVCFMKLFALPLLLLMSLVFVSASSASVPVQLPAQSVAQTMDDFRSGLLKAHKKSGIYNSLSLVDSQPFAGVPAVRQPAARQDVYAAIVGGSVVPDGTYPFAVRIESYDLFSKSKIPQPFCSGSLITAYYVLTAAHCIAQSLDEFDNFLSDTKLRVRFSNIRSRPTIPVVRTAYAGSFNPYLLGENSNQTDLAVLQLASPAKVAPAVIAAAPSLGETVSELGYGPSRPKESDGMSKSLRKGKMIVSGPAICGSNKYQLVVSANEICTTTRPPNLNGAACHGDSGGPLIYEPENYTLEATPPLLVGVTSWSKRQNCDTPSSKRQTVFANIMDGSDWLAQQTGLGSQGVVDHSTVRGAGLKIDAFNKRRAIISLHADDAVWGANASVGVEASFVKTKKHPCRICNDSIFVVGEFNQSAQTQTLSFPARWSKRKIKNITISSFLRFVGDNGNGLSVVPRRQYIR